MASPTEVHEFPLTLRVPKSAFVIVAPPPATVTQRTVEQHFGIPPRMYKSMVRDGLFPVKRIGKLTFAAYDDVLRTVTEGAETRARVEHRADTAVPKDEPPAPMSLQAAREYLGSARTPAETRARKKEIQDHAWELMGRVEPSLADGRPNPLHDAEQYKHALDLVLTASGAAPRNATAAISQRPGGHGKCCWCEQPAYALKQTWTNEHWSGAPVCVGCANGRKSNERIVAFVGETILHRATAPGVPQEYWPPRRRRRPKQV